MAPFREVKGTPAPGVGAGIPDTGSGSSSEAVGDVHFAAATFEDAVRYYQHALSTYGDRPVSDRVRVLLKISDSHRLHGDHVDALAPLAEARQLLASEPPGVDLARTLSREAYVLNLCGRYQDAFKAGREAYQLLRDTNENLEIGHIEIGLGTSLARQGDFTAARDYFERALATFRRIENEEGTAMAYNNLGLVAKNSGDLEGALRFLERALRLNERLGNYPRVTMNCLNLGIVRFKLGEWDIAREYLERALQMSRDTDNSLARVSALNSLACLLRRKRDFDGAEKALREALEACDQHVHLRELLLAKEFYGELEVDRGHFERAEALYTEALAEAERIAPEGDIVLELLRRMGDLMLHCGRPDQAEAFGRRALDLARRQHDRLEEATSWRLLALVAAARSDTGGYTALMDQAIQQLSEVGERFELATTLFRAGCGERKLFESGNPGHFAERSGRHLRRASALYASFDCEYYLAHTTLELAKLDLSQGRLDQALAELEEALKFGGPFRVTLESDAAEVRARLQDRYLQGSASSSNDFRLIDDVNRMFRDSRASEWSAELVKMLASRLPADVVFLAECEAGNWMVRARHGLRAEPALDLARAFSASTGSGAPVFTTSVAADPRIPEPAVQLLRHMGSIAALPFSVSAGVAGLMFVGRTATNPGGSLRQRELDLLTALTGLAGLASLESRRQALWEENRTLKEQLRQGGAVDGIVTQNPQMLEILSLLDKVSDASASVLLQGETGTGKGLVARAIHQRSHRRELAFVPINCAALPEPLLESELFGHVSGAFTGANRDKLGLFEEAEGGTIFLDEVDRLSVVIQGKLLDVLDRGEIRPVGGNRWKKVNVRVICATNADLRERIAQGRFLEDLYYRLNDFLISVPPLRERKADIPVLADFFRQKFAAQFDKGVGEFTEEVRQLFLSSPWRGNVREMEKLVKRMVVLAEPGAELGIDLLPDEVHDHEREKTLGRGKLWTQIADMERRAIAGALEDSHWNKSQAARVLGISYPSLLQKIKTFGLDRRQQRSRSLSA